MKATHRSIESSRPPQADRRTSAPAKTEKGKAATPKRDGPLVVAMLLGCVAAVAPLWVVTFPPLVDLPQHAAQLATWLNWHSGDFDYSQYFWSNSASPYILTNLLAYMLAHVVGIVASFKILTSIALVGMPLTSLVLLRESKGNPWWALATIPAAYSFPFFMGFTAFCVALPLALLALTAAWRYALEPRLRRGALLFALLQVLFLTHVLLFGWVGLIAALLVAVRSNSWSNLVRAWLPLVLAALAPAIWFVVTQSIDPATKSGAWGDYPIWLRAAQMLPLLAGLPGIRSAPLLGGLLIALPFLAYGRPSRDVARWIPFACTLLIYFLMPHGFFGTAFLHERFVVLVLPCLLFALDRKKRPTAHRSYCKGSLTIAAVAFSWCLVMAGLFRGYETEMGSLPDLLDQIPPSSVILYLPYDNDSDYLPYPVHLHSGLWYQVIRGGLVEFSFSTYFQNRFRYRPGEGASLPVYIAWRPDTFDWYSNDGERYDFILARSHESPLEALRQSRVPWIPLARARGGWWLWGPARSPRADEPSVRTENAQSKVQQPSADKD